MNTPIRRRPARLESMELHLHFYLGAATLDSDNSAEYAIFRKSFDLIDAGVNSVPGARNFFNKHGEFVLSEEEAVTVEPAVALCEPDGCVSDIAGRAAFSFNFQSGREIPLALALSLKELCLEKLRIAACDAEVLFAQGDTQHIWREVKVSKNLPALR